MRAVKTAGVLVAAVAMAAALPALAQAAAPTEFDYLCKLAPEGCIDGKAPTDAKDRENDRSFSLTRSAMAPKPQAVQAAAQSRARVGQSVRTAYAATTIAAPAPGRARRPAMGVSSGDMMMTFLNGSAELTSQARTNAAVLAKVMNTGLSGKRFVIEGHTNAVGTAESNLKLSQARADALVAYLVSEGVDRSRLEAKGYGFDRTLPGQPKASPANRRVEAKAIS